MSEQERLERAAEFGRQQAAELEAMMDAMCAEAAKRGYDGRAALIAAFAARPTVPLSPAAQKLYAAAAIESIPVRRARPRLVYSRD